jgi:single-strand DNA-binding protein
MSLNNVNLHGRLVGDPKLRYTGNGTAVANFTLAVEENYSKDGEDPKTNFIDCVVWRKLAEVLSKKTGKGNRLNVVGMIQKRKWQTDSGENRYNTEVKVDRADIIDWKESSQGSNEAQQEENMVDEDGLDVPF